MYVLDTSAFIHGHALILRGYTTPLVLSELKSNEANAYLWVIGERVTVEEPLPYYVRRARKIAAEVGEFGLSETDISVLALALQHRLPLVTDDYHLQNAALHGGVEVLDTGFGRIKHLRTYYWRCSGCGRVYRRPMRTCPHCGAPVFRYFFISEK